MDFPDSTIVEPRPRAPGEKKTSVFEDIISLPPENKKEPSGSTFKRIWRVVRFLDVEPALLLVSIFILNLIAYY